MRELAILTEDGNLDSIWVADHLLFQGGDSVIKGAWESVAMLGALADATTRVELGPLVLCTPFRDAGLIAWLANTLDEINEGRFVLGLGSGWHRPEFDAFGFEFDKRVSVLADSLEVIVPLLREGRVAYAGEFAAGHAELRPPGRRLNGPPILIAGSKPRMMSLIAKWADRWNSVWYGLPTDEFRTERGAFTQACLAIGRDSGHGRCQRRHSDPGSANDRPKRRRRHSWRGGEHRSGLRGVGYGGSRRGHVQARAAVSRCSRNDRARRRGLSLSLTFRSGE